jgi:hypothetical protein
MKIISGEATSQQQEKILSILDQGKKSNFGENQPLYVVVNRDGIYVCVFDVPQSDGLTERRKVTFTI